MSAALPIAALRWLTGHDTGASSKSLWAFMAGSDEKHLNYPHDGDDFGRCSRLLDAVPEWRARLPEIAKASPQWAGLVASWDEIEAAYREDYAAYRAGNRNSGAHTYALIKRALGERY